MVGASGTPLGNGIDQPANTSPVTWLLRAGLLVGIAGCAAEPPAAPAAPPIVLNPPAAAPPSTVARRKPAPAPPPPDATGLTPSQKQALFRRFLDTNPELPE